MNLYVIFNNVYSGIIQSQVIDRLKYVEHNFGVRYKLIVFISVRNFFIERQKYRMRFPNCHVIPMFGGLKLWWLMFLLLFVYGIYYRPSKTIGRAIFSTQLALWLRRFHLTRFVVYDGRGAVSAEWQEYLGRAGWPIPYDKIQELERNAIHFSDCKVAVSDALVKYWEKEFRLIKTNDNVTVLPCLFSQMFRDFKMDNSLLSELKDQLGVVANDCVFILSASKSDWQEFKKVQGLLTQILDQSSNNKVIILSNQELPSDFVLKYSYRVLHRWVLPHDVPKYYAICDYGILWREHSITNSVAAPVKFAEYLSAGLKIIISKSIGDYTQLVLDYELGFVIDDFESENQIQWTKPTDAEKVAIKRYAHHNFSMENYDYQLRKVFT